MATTNPIESALTEHIEQLVTRWVAQLGPRHPAGGRGARCLKRMRRASRV